MPLLTRTIHLLVVSIFVSVGAQPHQPSIPALPYGQDPEQIMDIYLPSSETERVTKVAILVHGGAWGGGNRTEMEEFIPFLQRDFPNICIANMEYRLGTHDNPGFPKQLDDIDLAISYLKGTFTQNVTFVLMGGSAGAHLSMLYGYGWDRVEKNVKAIINVVGPTDLNDPSYSQNPLYSELFYDLVGPCDYSECPDLHNASSPVTYVTQNSTKTIGFYGSVDFLVPSTQMPIIRNKLDEFGVMNKFFVYEGGHHWNWSDEDREDMRVQITEFLNAHW